MAKTVRKLQNPAAFLLEKKRVAAYARVSSGKDAMLHSLSAQVSYYSEFIQYRPDWEFVGIYADEALTGTKDARPEFQRLLSDCRAGRIDMVITKAISRFARNTLTLLQSTRELKALGVDVFFEEQKIHTNSGEGEMILSLLASVAQEESRAVSENCKWRIRNRFKNGEPVNWRFLYGYRIKNGDVEIEPTEAAIVIQIFKEYLNGDGAYRIANRLRDDNIPAYYGGEWTAKRVYATLKNEKYTGNALLQKTYVDDHLTKKKINNNGALPKYYAEGTHPPIISCEDFQRVNQLLLAAKEKTNAQKSHANRFPFSGKIQCGICGSYYRRKTNRGHVAWNCSEYLARGLSACQAKQIPEDILISLTTDVLNLPEFNENTFKDKISFVRILPKNTLVYSFSDGHEVETEWQDRSRSESWTEDMKLKAREKKLQQRRNV